MKRVKYFTVGIVLSLFFFSCGKSPVSRQTKKGPLPDKNVKADVIYICSPNNPTGAVYNKEQLKKCCFIIDRLYRNLISPTMLNTSCKDYAVRPGKKAFKIRIILHIKIINNDQNIFVGDPFQNIHFSQAILFIGVIRVVYSRNTGHRT